MSTLRGQYTVESVTSGHPDKVCDQISDAILDAYLKQDPRSRVAVESFGAHGLIVIGGEVTSRGEVDAEAIARKVYRDIGYTSEPEVIVRIVKQSPDIAMGVDTGGAGDQGIMHGYANAETDAYLPLGVTLAHKLSEGLERLRRSGEVPFLGPDGKSQVTLEGGKVLTVLISTQHDEGVELADLKEVLIEKLIKPVIGNLDGVRVLVNPTGKFVMGGFDADTGLTGRKLMVDTYGGLASHGGGAFSGKDSTKVDRSGAYMARFVAKNLVANGFAKEAKVSVAYAIGEAEPVMVRAENEKGEDLSEIVRRNFDFKPRAMIERLKLDQPIFQKTASYGHFGREGFPWEEIVKLV
jgi:S-adenosylmethionine synthetase